MYRKLYKQNFPNKKRTENEICFNLLHCFPHLVLESFVTHPSIVLDAHRTPNLLATVLVNEFNFFSSPNHNISPNLQQLVFLKPFEIVTPGDISSFHKTKIDI